MKLIFLLGPYVWRENNKEFLPGKELKITRKQGMETYLVQLVISQLGFDWTESGVDS